MKRRENEASGMDAEYKVLRKRWSSHVASEKGNKRVGSWGRGRGKGERIDWFITLLPIKGRMSSEPEERWSFNLLVRRLR
jgi:hypothetical protein